jgi:2-oxoglutarate dehydrogenase dihydrolipoamide succinyltransferase (E2 component)
VSSSPTETTVEITMPQMGISVSEGTIIEWRKAPGDSVEADETICDVTTDKVDVEIPSPASGTLAEIVVDAGETVAVGTVIGRLGDGSPQDEGDRPAGPVTEGDRPAGPVTEESPAPDPKGSGPAAPSAPPAGDEKERDRSKFHSPVVRRIADEHGLDLDSVEGSGIGGRVRKADVLAFLEGQGQEEKPGKVLHSDSPYKPEPVAAASGNGHRAHEVVEEAAPVGERREAMTPMRQRIAEHMVESRRTAAHCTTIVEADFSRVAARRAEMREAMRRRGVNLTYLAFVARATVTALEEHPVLNSSVADGEIVYHDDVNLGIAVALDEGLIVPVIPQAQRLSVEGLAAAIADVAGRARKGKLVPDDVAGGTFTITNPGQFGAVLATPIINQPQVAILDLEAIVKRPVVIEGEEGDSISIRPMSYLCMSWDHRALDGAQAARFLGRIRELLESGRVE